jgi:hypothetical protein
MGFSQKFKAIFRHRIVWLTVTPIVAGIVISLLVFARQANPPVAELPEVIDLGAREIGDVVVVPFSIANRGGEELVIDDIRTSCSCSGIEREIEGKFFRIESLNLNPGERSELVIRTAVRGAPVGTALHIVVYFRTNDPKIPEGRIEAVVRRVCAGVHSSPLSISFGTVSVNDNVRRVVVIRDTAEPPRAIQRLSSSIPRRVVARMLPVDEWPRDTEAQEAGAVIGCFEVLIDTTEPGEVGASVQIHLDGEMRTPDEIPVIGRVAPTVEIQPALLFLPRESSEGLIYTSTAICTSRQDEPIELFVDNAPHGVKVEIVRQATRSIVHLRVTVDPSASPASTAVPRREIQLRARIGEQEFPLRLTVVAPQ